MEYLVPVVCVHIRGVSPIQGAGLEGFHCIHVDSLPQSPVLVHQYLSLEDISNISVVYLCVVHMHMCVCACTCMCIRMCVRTGMNVLNAYVRIYTYACTDPGTYVPAYNKQIQ